MPGIGTRLPMLFSEGVRGGRITLQQFAALSAGNAARLYGLARKGSIAVGLDADLAIWDPDETRIVTAEAQRDNMDYTPFEGREVTGWPVIVLCRGARVVEDGALVAEPGHGRYVPRGRIDLTGRPGMRVPELNPATNFGAEIAP
jgi:dihydropyrimidinase